MIVKSNLALLFGIVVIVLPLLDTTFARTQPALLQSQRVYEIVQSGDRRVLAVSYFANYGRVDFFDAETGDLLDNVDLLPYVPQMMALSPSGNRLLWTDGGGTLGIYDRETNNNTILMLPSQVAALGAIAWSPSTSVFGYSQGAGLSFGDATTFGLNSGFIATDPYPIGAFAFSPDGQRIATSHLRRSAFDPSAFAATIQIWDNLFGLAEPITIPMVRFDGHGGGVITWSPDGERLAAYEPGGLVILSVGTGELEVVPFDDSTTSVTWSPDGTRLATGGTRIRIWDTSTWEVVEEFQAAADSLQWSPDGKFLFSNRGNEGVVRDEVTMDIDPTPTPSPTLILIDGIYRATQTVGDPRVYIERDMAAGIDPFDSDPVDGWTTIGRSNGAGNNGPLRAFTVIDDVPYAAMENAQRECVVVTPTSLRPRTANQTRTVKIAEKGNPARCAGDWAGFAP